MLLFFKLKILFLDFKNLSVSFGRKKLIKHRLSIHVNVGLKYGCQNQNVCGK